MEHRIEYELTIRFDIKFKGLNVQSNEKFNYPEIRLLQRYRTAKCLDYLYKLISIWTLSCKNLCKHTVQKSIHIPLARYGILTVS